MGLFTARRPPPTAGHPRATWNFCAHLTLPVGFAAAPHRASKQVGQRPVSRSFMRERKWPGRGGGRRPAAPFPARGAARGLAPRRGPSGAQCPALSLPVRAHGVSPCAVPVLTIVRNGAIGAKRLSPFTVFQERFSWQVILVEGTILSVLMMKEAIRK